MGQDCRKCRFRAGDSRAKVDRRHRFCPGLSARARTRRMVPMTGDTRNPEPGDRPDDPRKKAGPDDPAVQPVPTPLPEDNSDDMIDFNDLDTSGSKSHLSGPLSGTSIVSWTDLVKQ